MRLENQDKNNNNTREVLVLDSPDPNIEAANQTKSSPLLGSPQNSLQNTDSNRSKMQIELSSSSQAITVGEQLHGEVVINIDAAQARAARSLHVYVGYRIEGQGSSKEHQVTQIELSLGLLRVGTNRLPFTIDLAASSANMALPLSYQSVSLQIIWSVSAHFDIAKAKALNAETAFEVLPLNSQFTINTPIESYDLNNSGLLLPTILGIFFIVMIGVMDILARGSERAFIFYGVMTALVFLGAILMKAIIPKHWHFRKLGFVQMKVDDIETNTGVISGQIYMVPRENFIIDEISVALMTIEKSVIKKDEKVGTYTFTEILEPKTISDTLMVAKGRAVTVPFTIALPKGASPSFEIDGNELAWELQLLILSSNFELLESQKIEITVPSVGFKTI